MEIIIGKHAVEDLLRVRIVSIFCEKRFFRRRVFLHFFRMDNNAIMQYYKTLSDIVLIGLIFIVLILHIHRCKYNAFTIRNTEEKHLENIVLKKLEKMKVLKKKNLHTNKAQNDKRLTFRTEFVKTMYRQQHYMIDKHSDCELITTSSFNITYADLLGDWILVGNRRRKRYSSWC